MGRQGVSYLPYYGTENQQSAAPVTGLKAENGEGKEGNRHVLTAQARGEDSTAGGAGVAVNSPTFGGMRMPRICTTVKL
ncbi:hypothetical protein O988_08582 [Pseudogymnoascus sp. VKM F-3808]|nr:hypothetical protein O988_08582 [Pseudogymnoascus sp. VKM F-3808]